MGYTTRQGRFDLQSKMHTVSAFGAPSMVRGKASRADHRNKELAKPVSSHIELTAAELLIAKHSQN